MDTIKNTTLIYTPDQIREARDWLADASPRSDVSGWTPNSAYRMADNLYPGGWDAFVRECCTYVQL